jgi:hypothetical protein
MDIPGTSSMGAVTRADTKAFGLLEVSGPPVFSGEASPLRVAASEIIAATVRLSEVEGSSSLHGPSLLRGFPREKTIVWVGAERRRAMAGQVAADRTLLEGIGLSFGEAALLCDALRGLWLSPQFIERTWREMRELIQAEKLDQKWGTSGEALATRLAQLRRAEATALLRAAIRFWERREEPTAQLLEDLGMLRPQRHTRAHPLNNKRSKR